MTTSPVYLQWSMQELRERADAAIALLERCSVCPWECGVNRLADEKHVCRIGRYAVVASYFPHFGEENCLRGWRLESIQLLDGIVDIYMPDFKFWSPEKAKRYLKQPRYPEAARQVIRAMHQQVGDLQLDDRGLAVRGLLVRHLVMPGMLEETEAILRFLATEISRNT